MPVLCISLYLPLLQYSEVIIASGNATLICSSITAITSALLPPVMLSGVRCGSLFGSIWCVNSRVIISGRPRGQRNTHTSAQQGSAIHTRALKKAAQCTHARSREQHNTYALKRAAQYTHTRSRGQRNTHTRAQEGSATHTRVRGQRNINAVVLD